MGRAARINAERRRDEIGQLFAREVERWGRPPSEHEAEWLLEVVQLPRVKVARAPHEELIAAGMIPNDCHLNCLAQEKNDPLGLSKHVTGWMVDERAAVLHSVIHAAGQYVCITPQLVSQPPIFELALDPALEWIPDGAGARVIHRHGKVTPHMLRGYPEIHAEMLVEFNRLVEAGEHPFDAYQQVDATLGARLMSMPSLGIS